MAKQPNARYTAEVVRMDEGARHHLIPVPDAIAARLNAARVRRLLVTLNRHTIRRALQHHADGGSFIILGRTTLAALGLKRGSRVTVQLAPDPEPDVVEVPAELTTVLAQDAAAQARWATFTPGFRRSLAYYVASAKLEPTRIKRSLELARKIRTHTLHSDRARR